MIKKLNNKEVIIATQIHQVFQLSYAVEAELLKAINFPPLKRTVENFLISETIFYGFWRHKELAAVIEIKQENNSFLIQSLVVKPSFFRQGIAKKMMSFLFQNHKSESYFVETGEANIPAIRLYEGFGFVEIKKWDTDHSVRKVRFEKK